MKSKKPLSVADQHRLKIAKRTLGLNDVFANIMGGPNKEEAKEIIRQLDPDDDGVNDAEAMYS